MEIEKVFENTTEKLIDIKEIIDKISAIKDKSEEQIKELAGISRDLVVIAYLTMPAIEMAIKRAKTEQNFELFEKATNLDMLYKEVKLEVDYLTV